MTCLLASVKRPVPQPAAFELHVHVCVLYELPSLDTSMPYSVLHSMSLKYDPFKCETH